MPVSFRLWVLTISFCSSEVKCFLVSQILGVKTSHQLLNGLTTFETLRPLAMGKPNKDLAMFICIPNLRGTLGADCSISAHSVISVSPGKRMYDLGYRENFLALWRRPFIPSQRERYFFIGSKWSSWLIERHITAISLGLPSIRLWFESSSPRMNNMSQNLPSLSPHGAVPLLPQPTAGQFPAVSPARQEPSKREPPSEPDH